MNNFIKQAIDETFRSKKRQRDLYVKTGDRTLGRKERGKGAEEFSNDTEDEEKVHNGEVDEIVDADGNIKTGDEPGNPNAYIRSKKTTDQVAKSTMGQMGSFGVLGGATGGNKTLKYWAESDMSKALGNEIKNDSDMDLEDAVDYFEDDLEVEDGDEAKDRAKKMGFDPELPDGKMRLIEDPRKYIEEYLAQRGSDNELVKKQPIESTKKPIHPVLQRQLGSIKQTIKANGLTLNDIAQYLEDNE